MLLLMLRSDITAARRDIFVGVKISDCAVPRPDVKSSSRLTINPGLVARALRCCKIVVAGGRKRRTQDLTMTEYLMPTHTDMHVLA